MEEVNVEDGVVVGVHPPVERVAAPRLPLPGLQAPRPGRRAGRRANEGRYEGLGGAVGTAQPSIKLFVCHFLFMSQGHTWRNWPFSFLMMFGTVLIILERPSCPTVPSLNSWKGGGGGEGRAKPVLR